MEAGVETTPAATTTAAGQSGGGGPNDSTKAFITSMTPAIGDAGDGDNAEAFSTPPVNLKPKPIGAATLGLAGFGSGGGGAPLPQPSWSAPPPATPGTSSSSRGRVVSLDRRDLGLYRVDSNVGGGGGESSEYVSDDEDSSSFTSDGESSYFSERRATAPGVAAPGSGGISGGGGANASAAPLPSSGGGPLPRLGAFPGHSRRESDASLSFSDEDDEDLAVRGAVPSHVSSPSLLPPGQRASHQPHRPGVRTPTDELNQDGGGGRRHISPGSDHSDGPIVLFPRRRQMSSGGSLVESASSEDADGDNSSLDPRVAGSSELLDTSSGGNDEDDTDDDDDMSTTTSYGSSLGDTTGTSSDRDVRSELRAYGKERVGGRRRSGGGGNAAESIPSGRITPVQGMHPESVLHFDSGDEGGRLAESPLAPRKSPPYPLGGAWAWGQGRGGGGGPGGGGGGVVYDSLPHPMPQHAPLDPEQMAHWASMGPPPLPQSSQGGLPPAPLGHATFAPRRDGSAQSSNMASLVYSEDEDEYSGGQIGNSDRALTMERRPRSRGLDLVDRQGGSHSLGVDGNSPEKSSTDEGGEHKVYPARWLMLMYMSILNLLSDWTCYSVAPIATLTSEEFGAINPESLVTVFLGANAIATAAEPIILSRLGLRRTIVFGALLLMVGSIVKSGGLPGLGSGLQKGRGEWRVYLGFFLVGLSQPLYQCTPALLSGSWFPEKERTMATGVALNSNQLGIGCAFVFGTLLVATSDDIAPYFELLSLISTVTFIGCAIQFADAPPTPPSETARVIRGTLEVKIPNVSDVGNMVWSSIRGLPGMSGGSGTRDLPQHRKASEETPFQTRDASSTGSKRGRSVGKTSSEPKEGSKRTSGRPRSVERSRSSERHRGRSDSVGSVGSSSSRRLSDSSSRRRTSSASKSRGSDVVLGETSVGRRKTIRKRDASSRRSATSENGFRAAVPGMMPSPAFAGLTRTAATEIAAEEAEAAFYATAMPPSPMMPGPVRPQRTEESVGTEESEEPLPPGAALHNREYFSHRQQPDLQPHYDNEYGSAGEVISEHSVRSASPLAQIDDDAVAPDTPFANLQYGEELLLTEHQQDCSFPPVYSTNIAHYPAVEYPSYESGGYGGVDPRAYLFQQQAFAQQQSVANYQRGYVQPPIQRLPPAEDEGAEPVVTQTSHHLDIDIRDDQIIRSAKACFSRPGFSHSLVAFTTSGIVINTLSTYMDYLVRLQGAGREYVGVVGGSFQLLIMIASLIIGGYTDKTRGYYTVIIVMLVLGAFALAQCGVSLDEDRGGDLRWCLLLVAILAGPLQPVSTELGVDVAYPLSENTVLVIQQLFSNMLSALFIPFFQMLRDYGTSTAKGEPETMYEHPKYTFSFYLLVVIHTCATVYFATFNGRYLRLEAELAKKEREAEKSYSSSDGAFYPEFDAGFQPAVASARDQIYVEEDEPLLLPHRV